MTLEEACLILKTYSAPVHKYFLKYAIRYKIADYNDLDLTVIKDRHDFDAISVHVPGSKCFGRNVHLLEMCKDEHSSRTAIFQRKSER